MECHSGVFSGRQKRVQKTAEEGKRGEKETLGRKPHLKEERVTAAKGSAFRVKTLHTWKKGVVATLGGVRGFEGEEGT